MIDDRPQTGQRRAIRVLNAVPLLLAGVLALLALIHGIGEVALTEPDEGRNAEVAREMVVRGDFITPHLNGLPYLDKPVLFFAVAGAAIGTLGATEFAARLPSLLFTLATVLVVFLYTRRRFNRDTALLAGLVLITSPLVVAFSRFVIFDATMMFWVTAAVVSFHLGWQADGRRWGMLGWCAAGLAVLTKGPVGLVLPLLIALAEGFLCGYPRRRLFQPLGMLLFVLITLPWFLAVTANLPEFPHYAFVRETFERVATDKLKRTGPVYYILVFLVVGSLPWFAALIAAWRHYPQIWRERMLAARNEAFLLAWILVPLVFFTLSQSKRPGYILPALPAVAILGAHFMQRSPRLSRYVAWTAAGLEALLGSVLILGGERIAELVDGELISQALLADGTPLGGLLLAVSLLTAIGSRWRSTATAGAALLLPTIMLGGSGIIFQVGEHRSARDLTRAIQAAISAPVRVVSIEYFPISMPYYLQQPLLVATDRGAIMRSNYITDYFDKLSAMPGTTLRPAAWWREALAQCTEPSVFVALSEDSEYRQVLEQQLDLISDTGRYAAYGPCTPRSS